MLAYVRSLEDAIVIALSRAGLGAHARTEDGPDYTGVWIAERKIASIGVHVQRGVTTHGLAVNVEQRPRALRAGSPRAACRECR